MLVLSRHVNEKLTINGNITVQIVEVRGNKVKLGIDAPRDVPIERDNCKSFLNKHSVKSGDNHGSK